MRGHGDLEAAVGAAALCGLLALALPFELLRVLLALPLALFLPGYAISAAIFAHGRIERRYYLVFSLGLSLAVLALGGLVLNYVPGGIRSGSWAVLLFLVVLAACRGAALRRPRRAGAPVSWALPRFNAPQAALLAGGAVAIFAALVLAFTPVTAENATGYTEMWIEPLDGAAAGVRVGVGSGERDDSSYRLLVSFGRGAGEFTRRFSLEPGQSQILELRGGTPRNAGQGGAIPASATLFKEDSPDPEEPFRRVTTWVAPTTGTG